MLDSRQLRHADSAVRRVLPHGEGFATHRHERGHLVYAASGVLTVTTARGTAIVPADRAAWTPAGVAHHHQAYGRTEMRVLYLSEAFAPDPVVVAISPLVREVLLALSAERPYRSDSRQRLCEVLLDELRDSPEQPLHLPEPVDDRLRAVTDLLRTDPGNAATLSELTRRCGASERSLSRLFRSELGMSFRQWRTQLRIQHSLVMLARGSTVLATAHACGWSNPSSFIEAFASLLGETPARYRQSPPPTEAGQE